LAIGQHGIRDIGSDHRESCDKKNIHTFLVEHKTPYCPSC
jgi:hypothetical protein